ncbi:hypothetical protein BGZ80_009118 [Entomortierella chlamydospora]|uniref:FAD-binding domain-containing protein n=1 Tax=Entomortierella chlamydospora TaxID=101097 RepID=A0A9P6MWP4_9FUNG|nr:hypothetical protein BGZ79_009325 [Entomortierella chlamydospora]KAG0016575.1 hypothetical protein BGZ80_009118 [Entomortierella chlamydospora]
MPFSYKSGRSNTDYSNQTNPSIATSSSDASSTYPHTSHVEEPTLKVLIVGAGIGGLLLGYCLERAGIDYVILERAPRPHTTKTTIQFTANTLHAIDQLGLLEEVLKISKPITGVTLHKHSMSVVGRIDFLFHKERAEFCRILMSRMRPDRIQWGRKVLETVSGDIGVQCRCANGYVVQGDILVGADGAYSAVRQNLFRNLKEKSLLPKSDMESLKFTQNAIIGMTEPLDPVDFPEAATEFGRCQIVIGKDSSPYTLWITPTSENRLTWSVTGLLITETKGEQNLMVSQFGPEEVRKTCNLIESLESPIGGSLATLIAHTPEENMIKILVEEKHYKTWHHGRTVLMGDACHKFVSFSGQGPEQAMLDAICLANVFYGLKKPYPFADITEAFAMYHELRSPVSKAAVQTSGQMANLINGQGLGSEIKRKLVFNLPMWMQALSVDKAQTRPLLHFLPAIPGRGSKSVGAPSVKSV